MEDMWIADSGTAPRAIGIARRVSFGVAREPTRTPAPWRVWTGHMGTVCMAYGCQSQWHQRPS